MSTGRAQVDPPKAGACECVDQTHAESMECPERVAMASAEKRADGAELTWHQRSHLTVALAERGECGVSVQFAHLLHKEGREQMEDQYQSNSVE